jgi:hypothetical protein
MALSSEEVEVAVEAEVLKLTNTSLIMIELVVAEVAEVNPSVQQEQEILLVVVLVVIEPLLMVLLELKLQQVLVV